MQAALQKGAKPDSLDRDGRSAALIAAERGFPELVKLLVEAGADVNYMGDSPLSDTSILDYVEHTRRPGGGFFGGLKRKKVGRWLRERGAMSGHEIAFANGDDLAGLSLEERLAVLDTKLLPGRREFDRQLIALFDEIGPGLKERRVE